MSNRTVNLIASWAPLLSGGLSDCQNATDETCEGGVAAVAAYLRDYDRQIEQSEEEQPQASLVLNSLDKASPFVQMHPLGWSVNRLILNVLMGWKVFLSKPSILLQNKADFNISQRDISDLQSHDMPLLLTNAAVPPSNSWHEYVEAVHFDESTGMAVLSIDDSGQPLSWPQIESTLGVLNYIARENANAGCTSETSAFDNYANRTVDTENRRCWVSVVVYSDIKNNFDIFLPAVIGHENPPALVIDAEGGNAAYKTPRQVGPSGVWVVSYEMDDDIFYQHRISKSEDGLSVTNVTLITQDLKNLTAEVKDEKYASDIAYLRTLADQAASFDPVVGTSGFMPVAREGTYRRCKAGECEIGNLFTDALRWWADADVAFITSGGLRGNGWPAGEVRISNFWDALPFPNTDCTGVLSGVSLFKMLNYSTSVATFQGEDTDLGEVLLQVSGMRVTYNTELQESRLVAIEVWDKDEGNFLPVERLRLYKFATDSFLCGGYDPYWRFLGPELVIEGEEAGVIGEMLNQNIVGDYFLQLDGPYDTGIQGRLMNNTDALVALNLIQTEDSCEPGTYWVTQQLTCLQCPDSSNVAFLEERVEFEGESHSTVQSTGRIALVNSELFSVAVVPKSIPPWINFTEASIVDSNATATFVVENSPIVLQSGQRIELNFTASSSGLEAGTATGTVSFGVLDGGSYPGCVGQDATFDVFMRVSPSLDLNQLGSIRIAGWTFASIATSTALLFALLVYLKRESRVVKTMQPIFLITICVGVLVMAATIFPLSIDDGIASIRGCDIACMATPWLFSMGFTIAMSALFSKLWRINKLLNQEHLRRMEVHAKDVIAPFAVLFTLNFAFLLVWTLVDPLRWERVEVNGEKWNTYGRCAPEKGPVSTAMLVCVAVVDIGALILACYQAYKARNISDDFSEAKRIGIALVCWLQLFVVGIPVYVLIAEDNTTARFFLTCGLCFAMAMSMLLVIFVPIFVHDRRERMNVSSRTLPRARVFVTGMSTSFNRKASVALHNRSSIIGPGSLFEEASRLEESPSDNSPTGEADIECIPGCTSTVEEPGSSDDTFFPDGSPTARAGCNPTLTGGEPVLSDDSRQPQDDVHDSYEDPLKA